MDIRIITKSKWDLFWHSYINPWKSHGDSYNALWVIVWTNEPTNTHTHANTVQAWKSSALIKADIHLFGVRMVYSWYSRKSEEKICWKFSGGGGSDIDYASDRYRFCDLCILLLKYRAWRLEWRVRHENDTRGPVSACCAKVEVARQWHSLIVKYE